ncbi:pilus assembly protein PilM [Photobacterium aquae]|uniref:Pilus assembly protein PilM n=1 Tax=Photobacterium aquae TaxID=1195763 RepID=A0A0J1H6Y5_9GAMM|nr:type IV pilus assembly protein PilM [Photobacterium aquae]KLV07493.1 pilus assembly protein PilM [Photobacterium aquae]
MFLNPLIIGIDIGHHSIKAVALRQKKSKLELAAFAEVVLSASVVNDQHSVNAPALLSAVRKLKKAMPRGASKTVLALPDSAVISKVIQLDSHLSDDEAMFAVEQALSASSPFPIDELRIDFFPLESGGFKESAPTQPFQVFAARRETVDSRTETLRKARLSPEVVELQTHALLWLEQYTREQTKTDGLWGVINIGRRCTEFSVKPQNGAAYHRELAFGSESLPGMQQEGPSVTGVSAELVEQFTKLLSDNLKRQLQLYNSTHPRAAMQGVWLSGGGQQYVMAESLGRMLGIDVKVMEPLSGFECNPKLSSQLNGPMSQYAVAAGLAIRGGSQ